MTGRILRGRGHKILLGCNRLHSCDFLEAWEFGHIEVSLISPSNNYASFLWLVFRKALCFRAAIGDEEVLWDPGPSKELGSLHLPQGHSQAVRCLRFSPDGKWLASAADDHTVKVTPDPGVQAGPRVMLIIPRLCPNLPVNWAYGFPNLRVEGAQAQNQGPAWPLTSSHPAPALGSDSWQDDV